MGLFDTLRDKSIFFSNKSEVALALFTRMYRAFVEREITGEEVVAWWLVRSTSEYDDIALIRRSGLFRAAALLPVQEHVLEHLGLGTGAVLVGLAEDVDLGAEQFPGGVLDPAVARAAGGVTAHLDVRILDYLLQGVARDRVGGPLEM
jgi:hypothetical protein